MAKKKDTKDLGLTKAGKPRKRAPRKSEGRPTKYKPALCKKLIDYFADAAMQEPKKNGILVVPPKLPSIINFARDNNLDYHSIKTYRDKYPKFKKAYEEAREIRAWMLHNLALQGYYNATYAKYLGHNITDCKDKPDSSVSLDLPKEIVVNVVSAKSKHPK